MADFSDFILVSDLDGTLVDSNLNILKKDIDALKRFTEGGGLFTVATGRPEPSAQRFLSQLPINLPVVLANGGCIFDNAGRKTVFEIFMPDNAREVLGELCERFPELRAAVIKDNYYDVTYRDDGSTPFSLDAVKIYPADLNTLEYPWYKILCNICSHSMKEVVDFADNMYKPGISHVTSTDFYFELFPSAANKAVGIKKMLEISNISGRKLVCVGDYHNDIEMIKSADIGAAAGGAPDEVKAAADIILCDIKEGSVSQLVKRLEAI